MPTKKETYFDILDAAINDMLENGFDGVERVNYWLKRLADAAQLASKPLPDMEQRLRDVLIGVYKHLLDGGPALARYHPGLPRFTIERLRPTLHTELERRIAAAADLIKLNRTRMIQETLQRFSGWATSIPKGGTEAQKRKEVAKQIRKPLATLSFRERRVMIDQGHKFASSLNSILATDGGAVAAIWHSHWRQPGYNYRPDHKERDLHVYAIRGNWAIEKGLMKVGPDGYTDEITQPGEEVYCRCQYQYLYALRTLPEAMLTAKGKLELANARKKVEEMVNA